jgi:hypothetical protein
VSGDWLPLGTLVLCRLSGGGMYSPDTPPHRCRITDVRIDSEGTPRYYVARICAEGTPDEELYSYPDRLYWRRELVVATIDRAHVDSHCARGPDRS